MRIVIDLQGAQTQSRVRGIGRYSIEIVLGLIRNRGPHEILILLNGVYADTVPEIRALFNGLLPQENIVVWEGLERVAPNDPSNTWRRQAGELLRETLFASLQPDILLITSLFEGFNEDAISSVRLHFDRLPTAIILHDLIPYIHPETYLSWLPHRKWYFEKIEQLKRANLWLAVSQSSRREAIDRLGLVADRCIHISAAADPKFRPPNIFSPEDATPVTPYGVRRPFILTAGGTDPRKNIERIVKCWAQLPLDIRDRYQLVVYGCGNREERWLIEQWGKKYGLEPNRLIALPRIGDEDLVTLYNLCELFVFPSWHEGFGLPALEAMQCGAPVIGANASSLPEIIGRQDALFDPYSETSIANAIQHALRDSAYRDELRRHGTLQSRKFSWDWSARQALEAFVAYSAKQTVSCLPNPRREALPTEETLVAGLAAISHATVAPDEEDLIACAYAMDFNEQAVLQFQQARGGKRISP